MAFCCCCGNVCRASRPESRAQPSVPEQSCRVIVAQQEALTRAVTRLTSHGQRKWARWKREKQQTSTRTARKKPEAKDATGRNGEIYTPSEEVPSSWKQPEQNAMPQHEANFDSGGVVEVPSKVEGTFLTVNSWHDSFWKGTSHVFGSEVSRLSFCPVLLTHRFTFSGGVPRGRNRNAPEQM